MKFDVFNRFTGAVQFTAEIECAEDESFSIKLGLAVKWAIKARANLAGANLAGAYLAEACLARAYLAEANLAGAYLAGANLAGANLAGANLAGAKGLKNPPISFGCVGKYKRTGFVIIENEEIVVRLGCFKGSEKGALKAVGDKYGKKSGYVAMIKAACLVAREYAQEAKE